MFRTPVIEAYRPKRNAKILTSVVILILNDYDLVLSNNSMAGCATTTTLGIFLSLGKSVVNFVEIILCKCLNEKYTKLISR